MAVPSPPYSYRPPAPKGDAGTVNGGAFSAGPGGRAWRPAARQG
jgi:hypothetical protein